MSSNLASTSWPSTPVSDEVKDLLARFFQLVDLRDPNAGKAISEEIFLPDGVFVTAVSAFTGKSEIANCRAKAWDTVASRDHRIEKVYASGKEAKDLVLIGTLYTETTQNTKTRTEFAARVLVDADASGAPRIKHYQPFLGTHATI